MCGLAGVFRWRGRVTGDDVAGVLAMLEAQMHRGPDDWGVLLPASLASGGGLPRAARDGGHAVAYRDGEGGASVVLGARRLSILDRSERGRMPMGDEGERRFVAHNGEISNHR